LRTENKNNSNSKTRENMFFVFGFINDVEVPYYDFAEKLNPPAAYFRNDKLYYKYKALNSLGTYWQIISTALDFAIKQR
jgi:hypothetical protein